MDNSQTLPTSFESLNLKIEILRGIYSNLFEKPTITQSKILSSLSSFHDVMVIDQPSTGKTTSYVIYSLQLIDTFESKDVNCLVLTSTRDEALSIAHLYNYIGKYTNVKIHAFVGGTSIKEEIKQLSKGCHIVVGTPGRVLDMINKKIISLCALKLFIIDEIAEVFNRGFSDSIKSINALVGECQKAFFSSSGKVPEKIENILHMKNLNVIKNKEDNIAMLLNHLKQFTISIKEEWKFDVLVNLFKFIEIGQTLIYCSNRKESEKLNDEMNRLGFSCSYLSDDKDKLILNFRNGNIRVVIVTGEVSAKEIDFYQQSVIINYDMPTCKEEYLFRVGRGEAFSRRGIVINFITEKDKNVIEEIKLISKGEIMEELPNDFSLNEVKSIDGR